MELAVRPGARQPLEVQALRRLAGHGFGHVLGLGRCHACDSIMNYESGRGPEPQVTDLDVRTFLRLLEVPNGAVVAGSAAGRGP